MQGTLHPQCLLHEPMWCGGMHAKADGGLMSMLGGQTWAGGAAARAGMWGLLMGRSCTMFRLGPRQVNVKKGFGTEGAPPGIGTDRIVSFTCMQIPIEPPHLWCVCTEQMRASFQPLAAHVLCIKEQDCCRRALEARTLPQGSQHHLRQLPGVLSAEGPAQIERLSDSDAGCHMCSYLAQRGRPEVYHTSK